MARGDTQPAGLYSIATQEGQTGLRLRGDWSAAAKLPCSDAAASELASTDARTVIIDGSGLDNPHPRAAAFVYGLARRLEAAGVTVGLRAMPASITSLFDLAGRPEATPEPPRCGPWLTRLGAAAWSRIDALRVVSGVIGNAAVATPRLLLGRAQVRWVDFVALLRETGASSLPVVTVVNLLIGAVLGFVGAIQLGAFGAGLYLADLVGIAVAREMAAIMTAFIMAGRIGASFAAQLATMESNEEIDALRMIGVSPFEFLVLPRLAALTLMMPLLFLYAAALGIGGGMIVAEIALDTSPASFLSRLQDAVPLRHFVIGLVKAICFGVLIALTSCHLGMRAGRNAAEVGRAATRTVVVAIIGIILIDALFALCTNALGI